MILKFLLGKQLTDLNNKLDEFLEEIEADKQRAGKLEKELEEAKKEKDKYKNLIVTVGNTIPDLMWAKDLEGKYIYANPEILETLFYNLPLKYFLGKTDVEITQKCKKIAGADRHTFGEICANSDVIVLDNMKKQRFLEHGLVDGKDLYLEVYKAPLFNSRGMRFGTVGTGRDVTEWYLGIRQAITSCGVMNCADRNEALINELNKYKFEG